VRKITKWGVGMVMTLAMMFMAGQVSAVTLGMYDTGQLVPKVIYNGTNVDTVVGLQCRAVGGCDVYWSFFDDNSTHITDGMIKMTKDDYYGFSWRTESGMGLEGVNGYLVFTSGNNATALPTGTNDIFANAFMVDTASKDAVLVPVLPLTPADYDPAVDLRAMTATSIVSLISGSVPGAVLDIRYWIDPAYSATTQIVLWSVCDASGIYPVNMYNDKENRKSVNFKLPNKELNIVDPATLVGRPADFIDGFLRFPVPAGACVAPEVANDMFVFSYVNSDVLGAMQTLLAGETGGGVGPGPGCVIDGQPVNCATDCTIFGANIQSQVQCGAWQNTNCP